MLPLRNVCLGSGLVPREIHRGTSPAPSEEFTKPRSLNGLYVAA